MSLILRCVGVSDDHNLYRLRDVDGDTDTFTKTELVRLLRKGIVLVSNIFIRPDGSLYMFGEKSVTKNMLLNKDMVQLEFEGWLATKVLNILKLELSIKFEAQVVNHENYIEFPFIYFYTGDNTLDRVRPRICGMWLKTRVDSKLDLKTALVRPVTVQFGIVEDFFVVAGLDKLLPETSLVLPLVLDKEVCIDWGRSNWFEGHKTTSGSWILLCPYDALSESIWAVLSDVMEMWFKSVEPELRKFIRSSKALIYKILVDCEKPFNV